MNNGKLQHTFTTKKSKQYYILSRTLNNDVKFVFCKRKNRGDKMNNGKLQHTMTIDELKQHHFCRVYVIGDLILHFAIEKKTGKTVYIIDGADFRDAIQDGILQLKLTTRDIDYFEYNENHKQENTL